MVSNVWYCRDNSVKYYQAISRLSIFFNFPVPFRYLTNLPIRRKTAAKQDPQSLAANIFNPWVSSLFQGAFAFRLIPLVKSRNH
jgi:hypothetical protein